MAISVFLPAYSRLLSSILKVVVLGVFFFLLYQSFHQHEKLLLLRDSFAQQIQGDRVFYLAIALLLVSVNWLLEAIKWQRLTAPIQKLTLQVAVRAVLIGLTTSIFTPNRIGEYIGRVIIMAPGKKLGAVSVLSLGSMVQLILLAFMGLASFSYLASASYQIPYLTTISWILVIGCALLAAIIIVLLPQIYTLLKSRYGNYWPAIWGRMDFLKNLPSGYFREICVITFLRIVIYVLQYWLLLQFFLIEVRPDLAVATILLGYLVQSGLPLPSLLALVARGEITLLLWNFFGVNELSILAASYGLWVINVVFPALVGLMFVMKIKINSI